MVVIIRATNDPSARAKAGGIMRAMEAAQTVEGKDWHGMKPPVYRSGPDPLRRLARPACGISGSRPTAGERPQA